MVDELLNVRIQVVVTKCTIELQIIGAVYYFVQLVGCVGYGSDTQSVK